MIDLDILDVDYPYPSSAAETNWAAQQVAAMQALAAGVNATVEPLTWAALTPAAPWDNKADEQATESALSANGIVYVRAALELGASGTAAFTLPAGQRPPVGLIVPVIASGGMGTATIGVDGQVFLTDFGGDVSAGCYLNFCFSVTA